MSSSPLYLAIVVVWLIVLVPMLMRRDAAEPTFGTGRRADDDTAEDGAEDPADESVDEDGAGDPLDDPDSQRTQVLRYDGGEAGDTADPRRPGPRPRPLPAVPGRARVIARRRRRTTGLTTLFIATAIAVASGLGAWWVLAPPALLLAGHVALLREAAKADAERRVAELREHRRRAALRARRAREQAAREAEVVDLSDVASRRDQVYDQYADAHLRAAGD
ncbi:hypothetical protein CDO52_06255 [Nocardiopsis gilva YIM 90087]|uniref:Uncharacterized protein n=1 Tax=Nocardiopsis gilva YIM 90087 TaxID=1235441 RepID=A0A223S2T8_9ACTN|nr:hypothetical protein [Nocardiopsis gilva]ASU82445.1 hypothetical protein CDO52_06255 [Nocardiopsis gilva YIM 90087]